MTFAKWSFKILASMIAITSFSQCGAVGAAKATENISRCDPSAHLVDMKDAARHIDCYGLGRRLWVIADTHGTRDIPEMVQDMLSLVPTSVPVTVALEMQASEQKALDAYLESSGSSEDVGRLLNAPFWHLMMRDGRSSVAVLALIERVRQWRANGRRIDIVAVEPDYLDPAAIERAGGFAVYKDLGLASSIRATLDRNRDGVVIAVMGSFHARVGKQGIIPGVQAPGPSVVEQLSNASPLVIWPEATKGNAWNCIADRCGVHPFGVENISLAKHPTLIVETLAPGNILLATLVLPTFSASLPAVPVDQPR
jgi:hypothetical protein